MISVKVTYKYSPIGQKPNVQTNETIQAEGKTEDAVMNALKKRHPNREIIIIQIN